MNEKRVGLFDLVSATKKREARMNPLKIPELEGYIYELTDWFPPNEKPSLAGVYQTLEDRYCFDRVGSDKKTFRKWDGGNWGISCEAILIAAKSEVTSKEQEIYWRGAKSEIKGR